MFESLLNPIFEPLLRLGPFLAVLILSVIITVMITFIYKVTTNQRELKEMKEKLKQHQNDMKTHRHDHEKVMQIQKQAMEINMKYMMHSMKPTIITFLPIIIIFGWLHANIAYQPIMPGQEFTTTALFENGATGNVELTITPENQVELLGDAIQPIDGSAAAWKLKGPAGDYTLEYKHKDEVQTMHLLISDLKYSTPERLIKNSSFKSIAISNEKTRPLGSFHLGSYYPGWLMTYIIVSLVVSMVLRKVFKIY